MDFCAMIMRDGKRDIGIYLITGIITRIPSSIGCYELYKFNDSLSGKDKIFDIRKF